MRKRFLLAARAAGLYLLTNKRARAAEWTLLLGIVEAVRSAIGHP